MAEVTQPRPLSEEDERSQFDCGRDSLNVWFRRHAWANQASGASRVNVIGRHRVGTDRRLRHPERFSNRARVPPETAAA
jgi:hypothetical protein